MSSVRDTRSVPSAMRSSITPHAPTSLLFLPTRRQPNSFAISSTIAGVSTATRQANTRRPVCVPSDRLLILGCPSWVGRWGSCRNDECASQTRRRSQSRELKGEHDWFRCRPCWSLECSFYLLSERLETCGAVRKPACRGEPIQVNGSKTKERQICINTPVQRAQATEAPTTPEAFDLLGTWSQGCWPS